MSQHMNRKKREKPDNKWTDARNRLVNNYTDKLNQP